MKGITQYIIILAVTVFITIGVFYLLSQLLSKEVEVSTLSRKIASIVSDIEYSRKQFIELKRNDYFNLKKSGIDESEIISIISKPTDLKLDKVHSTFEIKKIENDANKLKLNVIQKSIYEDSSIILEAESNFSILLN
jgi:hypothetical protein